MYVQDIIYLSHLYVHLLISKNIYESINNKGGLFNMSKFSNDVQQLLEYIGGKGNISAVTHCATRMRFVLQDVKKADIKNIEKIKSVKGVLHKLVNFRLLLVMKYQHFIMNL